MIPPVVTLATGALASATVWLAAAERAISDPALIGWGGVAALPLVVGIVEVLKRAGLPDKWAGLVSLILGVGGGLAYGGVAGLSALEALPQGLLVGLAAAGAWSTTKSAGRGR